MTANLPPMLPLPEPAGVMDITTDYVGYVGTFKVWTEHSVRAYAESERQQVAAALLSQIEDRDAEVAEWKQAARAEADQVDRLTAERDNLREQVNALAARVAELERTIADAIESICEAEAGHACQTLRDAIPAAPARGSRETDDLKPEGEK